MKKTIRKVASPTRAASTRRSSFPGCEENYGCEVVAVAVDVGQAEETSGLGGEGAPHRRVDFHLHRRRARSSRATTSSRCCESGAVYETRLPARHGRRRVRSSPGSRSRSRSRPAATRSPMAARARATTRCASSSPTRRSRRSSRSSRRGASGTSRRARTRSTTPPPRGIPVAATKKDPYSRDRNLWHLSHEGGPLEDPACEPEPSMFKLTVDPEHAPDEPERVTISFEAGLPVAVDGQRLSPARAHRDAQRDRRPRTASDGRTSSRTASSASSRAASTRRPGGTLLVHGAPGARGAHPRPRQRRTRRSGSPFATPSSSTSGSGSRRCARRSTPSSQASWRRSPAASRSSSTRARRPSCGRTSPYSLYARGLASFDMSGYTPQDAERVHPPLRPPGPAAGAGSRPLRWNPCEPAAVRSR